MFAQNTLILANAIVSIKFCSSITIILLRVNNISNRWPESICAFLKNFKIWLTVVVSSLMRTCVLVLISIWLLCASISRASVNFIFSKSLASGVPATTFYAVSNKSKVLATLWWALNELSISRRWAISILIRFLMWDWGNILSILLVSSTTRLYSERLAECLT